MSEINYYKEALKRFKMSNMKLYLSSFSDRWKMHKWFQYTKAAEKKETDYICVRGGSQQYLCRCDDITIPMTMYDTGRAFSDDEIIRFFQLCQKYYHYSPSMNDIFLDIGANIGTTSIYVEKNVYEKLKIFAFEPEPENYKLLCANRILNDCHNISTVNAAVSDKNVKLKLGVTARNRGANRVISENEKSKIFPDDVIEVPAISIDSYIKQKSLDPERIKYIWIDVEGHEPQVLFGMRNLLTNHRIPLYTEFSPRISSRENIQEMQELLKEKYKGIIIFGTKGAMNRVSIEKLVYLYDHSKMPQYSVFFF